MRVPIGRIAPAILIAALCLTGCKKPELGFTAKAADNSMETFFPGYWVSDTGVRFEITQDEVFDMISNHTIETPSVR
jgi:hypothetical protein